jgi:hypothetical protein
MSTRAIALALLVFAGCGTLAVLQARLAEAKLPRPEPLAELSYYPSGTWLAPAAWGSDGVGGPPVAARGAVLRAPPGDRQQFLRMGHVFDIVTTLDPRFQSAYVFGGTSLCQEAHQFEAGSSCSRRARATTRPRGSTRSSSVSCTTSASAT